MPTVHLGAPAGATRSHLGLTIRDDQVAPILIFLAFAAYAATVAPQSDTFTHLRAGREIWQAGAPITQEPFSHTTAGAPWHNHEWLSQLFMYAAFSVAGMVLLTIVAGASAFVAVLWSWRLMRGSYELRLILLVSLVLITPSEWAIRPQVFSMLALMLALELVLRDRAAWLPLLAAVWANAHGGVLFGVVLAGAHACDAFVWTRARRVRAIGVLAACMAAPMLSPLGPYYWPRVVQTVSEARLIGIHEFRPAFEIAALPFWLLLLGLAASLALQVRLRGIPDRQVRVLVLTAAALGVASVMSVRNAPFFSLVAAPAISRLLAERFPHRTSPQAGRLAPALLALGAIAAVAFVAYRWRDQGMHLGWQPISANAVGAIRACPGPIFNTYGEGGFLLWFVPEQAVFIDGRMESYPLRLLERSRRADLHGEYRELFDEYGVRCAVVPADSVMDRALGDDASMRLWFRDTGFAVFASRDATTSPDALYEP